MTKSVSVENMNESDRGHNISRRLVVLFVASLLAFSSIALTVAYMQPTKGGPITPPAAGPGGCPSIEAIGNFLPGEVSASASSDGTTVTYTLSPMDEGASGGIPGLIAYCVYPPSSAGNPTSGAAVYDEWTYGAGTMQGYFNFNRPNGNPTNIPFDAASAAASPITVGTATWPTGTAPDPSTQVILLHINNPAVCDALYGGNPGTCFVYPSPGEHQLCNGDPACKQVTIDEMASDGTVPAYTLLHIHYSYTIVNQPGNSFDMIFNVPTPKTQDINTGGGKDNFGCEQTVGFPAVIDPYQSTNMKLTFYLAPGIGCSQSRLLLQAGNWGPITLTPGNKISFTVDMTTRINGGGNQEYTSCGSHFLNSGFTVKWFQSDDGLLHSFTTSPISVTVTGCS